MFYEFTQNNSGGSFNHNEDAGIGYSVIVEADDADEANYRAGRIGLYFNGCATGADCDCCGDRWSEVWSDDEGDEVPSHYGQPITKGGWGISSYVHYKDGRIERFRDDRET